MSVPIPFDSVDTCFRFVQHWNIEAKKELIIRIVQSLPQSGTRDASVVDAALSKAQRAFECAAVDFGVKDEDDVQRLVNVVRYPDAV